MSEMLGQDLSEKMNSSPNNHMSLHVKMGFGFQTKCHNLGEIDILHHIQMVAYFTDVMEN